MRGINPQLDMNPTKEVVSRLVDNLDSVTVNTEQVNQFADEHAGGEFELPSWDAPVFPEVGENFTNEDVVDFFVVGNALNFCFNNPETGQKFQASRNGMEFDGAFAMWLCLYHEQTDGRIDFLDPEELKEINLDDFNRVFASSNNVEMPLKKERVKFLNQVGDGMSEVGGSFAELISDGTVSAFDDGDGFVENLIDVTGDAYSDTRTYLAENVPFNKRAQLATMMLHGFFQDDEFFTLEDTDNLTIPADYGVPNTLRSLGILEYDPELATMIDDGNPLHENSVYEVEIRIATVYAGELLCEELNDRMNADIEIPRLDYYLWSLRRDTEHPEHLTVTTAY